MVYLLGNELLTKLLADAKMTQMFFIEECIKEGIGGESTIRKYLSGERKIPNFKVKGIFEIINTKSPGRPYVEQAENKHTKEKNECEVAAFVEEALKDIVTKAVNHFTPFEIYTFWANRDVYANISIEAADFFAKTTDLSLESRQDMLAFMEQMEIKVKTVRETSKTILKFLDMRDNGSERTKNDFNTQCKRHSEKEIKKNRWKDIENLLNSQKFDLSKFYTLAPFFTTMDALDWDLLIAYTVTTHENAGRAEEINQKLKSMLED